MSRNGPAKAARDSAYHVAWAQRKNLQNDELVEYALAHSDLFYPSLPQREERICNQGTAH